MRKDIKHLKNDPAMAKLISQFEPFEWHERGSLYEDLLSCIVGQQLSVKAADTIWKRVETLVNHDFSPINILKIPDDKFREAGMSWAKVAYFKGIAVAQSEGKIKPKELEVLSDEDLIKELTKLKGIGKWSAEMIMIFTLNRPDVFSLGDLGLRTAVSKLYGIDREDLNKISQISDKWSPFRSLACRYLWKSLDNAPK